MGRRIADRPPGRFAPESDIVAPVTILTGARGTGKTLFCRALANHPGAAGVYSPPCETAPGRRYGMDAVLVPGGTRFPLARITHPERTPLGRRRRSAASYTLDEPPRDDSFDDATIRSGIARGPFTFSAAALVRVAAGLTWGARLESTRLVIIDEVGPLEVEEKSGLWTSLLELLRGSRETPRRALLIVARPSLVVSLSALVRQERPGANPETVTPRDFANPGDPRTLRALTR